MAETDNLKPRPPIMSSRKKLIISDEELTAFYVKLREYYLNLDFDSTQVTREQKYYQVIARLSRFFANLKGTIVLNKERIKSDDAMIYTSNHIGSFDQFYMPSILGDIPLHYLVKSKVKTWLIRWNLIYKPTGVVVIDTDNFRSWGQAKAKLIQYLLHGSSVFIFAEGSRRGENNIGEFSSGVTQIAQETSVKIGTLAIKNTSKIFLRIPIVCAGETFSVEPREDLQVATERIRLGVIDAYNEILKYESDISHEHRH